MKKKFVFILTLAIIMLFPTLNPNASTAKINLKEASNGSVNTTLHFEDGFVGGFDLVFKVSDNVKVKNVDFNSDYAKNKFTTKYSYDAVNHTLRIIVTTGGIGSNHNLLNKNRELSLGNINFETSSKANVQYTLEKVSLSYNDNNWQLKKIASNDLALGDNKFTLVVKAEETNPPKEEETTPPKEEDDEKENQGGTTGGNTGSDNDKEDEESQGGSTGNTSSGDKEEDKNQGGTSSGSTSESKPSIPTTGNTGSVSGNTQTKPNQNNGTTSNKTDATTPNTGNVGDGKVETDAELPNEEDKDTDIDIDEDDNANNEINDTTTDDSNTKKEDESGNKLVLIITIVAIAVVVGILIMVYLATKTKKPLDF